MRRRLKISCPTAKGLEAFSNASRIHSRENNVSIYPSIDMKSWVKADDQRERDTAAKVLRQNVRQVAAISQKAEITLQDRYFASIGSYSLRVLGPPLDAVSSQKA